MKYRIREEVSYGGSVFYTERWHEPYNDWVAALHCSFSTLEEAQKGLDFWNSMHTGAKSPNVVMHDYTPR